MDEPGQKRWTTEWLLWLLFGRGLWWMGAKIFYWLLALLFAGCAWGMLTVRAEAAGISLAMRMLMAVFLIVTSFGMAAMARSVDVRGRQDAESEPDPPSDSDGTPDATEACR